MRCPMSLQDFKNLPAALGPLRMGADPRYVIRLLANAHHSNVRETLRFLDESAAAWPGVLKKLLQQTSESQFRQTLAELRVLSHLTRQSGVSAKPAITARNSKHHDIDATAAGVAAKIEIYSPSAVAGAPLLDQHISPLFKFLEVPVGFHVELSLEPLAVRSVKQASDVGTAGQVARWLTRLRGEAEAWISAFPAAGASKSWEGPNKSVRLTVEVRKISENRAARVVTTGTGATPFDQRDAGDLRLSSWGKKVFDKMRERQCGEYAPGTVRVLVIDFSGLGTSSRDCFRTIQSAMFSGIESALQMAAADAGAPTPYDGAVLAWVDDPIVFAPVVALHPRASADLQKFVGTAALAAN